MSQCCIKRIAIPSIIQTTRSNIHRNTHTHQMCIIKTRHDLNAGSGFSSLRFKQFYFEFTKKKQKQKEKNNNSEFQWGWLDLIIVWHLQWSCLVKPQNLLEWCEILVKSVLFVRKTRHTVVFNKAQLFNSKTITWQTFVHLICGSLARSLIVCTLYTVLFLVLM